MLDAAQRASANAIVDIFEFFDLDPAVDAIVYENGKRYHRHPNGRFGFSPRWRTGSIGSWGFEDVVTTDAFEWRPPATEP